MSKPIKGKSKKSNQKEGLSSADLQRCVQILLANPHFKAMKGKSKTDTAILVCKTHIKLHENKCTLCDIEDGATFKEALQEVIKSLNVPSLSKNDMELENYNENSEIKEDKVSKEDLEKINKFAIKPLKDDEIISYTALLVDDQITRNSTQYSDEFQKMLLSLPVGEGNFVGCTFLLGERGDHEEVATAQMGRVFDAWQVTSEEGHIGVMGKIYIMKEGNEEVIGKIDSGILKEVSIATKVELPICSICNQDIRECEHIKGKDGCYVKMSGKGFVGEVSLVAIPGSAPAKILNDEDKDKYVPMEAIQNILNEMHEMKDALDQTNQKVYMMIESGSVIPGSGNVSTQLTASGVESVIREQFDSHFETDGTFKVADQIDNPADKVKSAILIAEVLNKVNDDTIKANEKIVKYSARYSINAIEISSDPTPNLTQGVKSGDVYNMTNILMTRVEVLDNNLKAIEKIIKFNIDRPGIEYKGTNDETQIEPMVRYLNEKISDILTRVYQFEGRFSLEEEEKESIIKETVRIGILANMIKLDKKEDASKLFQNMSLEQVKKTQESFLTETHKLYGESKEIDEPDGKPKTTVNMMDYKDKI